MTKFAPALIALTLSATQVFAQDSTGVEPVIEPGEIFDVCAEEALRNTPEVQRSGKNSSPSYGDDYVEQDGTRLQLDGQGGVTASGPGAETAIRQFIDCFGNSNLTL